jgi:hypothetical protein
MDRVGASGCVNVRGGGGADTRVARVEVVEIPGSFHVYICLQYT